MKAVVPILAAVFVVIHKMIENRRYWLGPILSVFFALGYLNMGNALADEQQANGLVERLEQEEDADVSVTGLLVRLDLKGKSVQGTLKDVVLESGAGTLRLKKLVVYLPQETLVREGDRIRVNGTMACFGSATNPGQFDYRIYQAAHGVYLQVYGMKAAVETEGASPVDRMLGEFRRYAQEIFLRISSTAGGTMAAMVLGEKADLPDERYELYMESGIGHILTLSGLHMSLLGVGLFGFLRKRLTIPPRPAALVMTAVLLLYVRLIGSGISAVRAMVAIVCSLFAVCTGKTYDSLSAAGIGLLLILWEYPLQIERAAFWLSFGAVFAVGSVLPELTRWLKPKGKTGKAVISALTIWLALMPVTAANQYTIQPYSLLLNLAVIPMMGPILMGCIVLLLMGMLYPETASWLSVSLEAVFEGIDAACELVMGLPGSQLVVGAPGYRQMLIYYGAGLFLFWRVVRINRREWEAPETSDFAEVMMGRTEKRKKGKQRWLLMTVVCAGLMLILLNDVSRKNLRMVFMDVGPGDCIYIQLPGEIHMMIDGGSSSEERVGEYRILPCLNQAGCDRLDYLVVTHLDGDHMSGVKELLESGFSVDRLLLSKKTQRWDEVEEICLLAERNKTEVVMIGEKDRIICGEVEINCIGPGAGSSPQSENEASVVLELRYGEFSCLFTGDVEGTGEKWVEAYVEDKEGYTLLKVAHHGSKYSTSEAFLATVKPLAAVISCGEDNVYGHPHEELLARLEAAGSDIFCTANGGAVIVESDGVRWKIYGYGERNH